MERDGRRGGCKAQTGLRRDVCGGVERCRAAVRLTDLNPVHTDGHILWPKPRRGDHWDAVRFVAVCTDVPDDPKHERGRLVHMNMKVGMACRVTLQVLYCGAIHLRGIGFLDRESCG